MKNQMWTNVNASTPKARKFMVLKPNILNPKKPTLFALKAKSYPKIQTRNSKKDSDCKEMQSIMLLYTAGLWLSNLKHNHIVHSKQEATLTLRRLKMRVAKPTMWKETSA